MLIKGRAKDHGVFFQFKCTACDVMRWFHLVEYQASVKAVIVLDQSSTWSLKCSACRHSIDISAEDAGRALPLLAAAQSHASGKIDSATFGTQLKQADLTFMKMLALSDEEWVCPKCREHCPQSFAECWSCGSARPDEHGYEPPPDFPTPSLDTILTHDRPDPCGGLKL